MAKIKLQNIYQEQELKLLEDEILTAKRFLEQNAKYHLINAICLVLGPSGFGKSTLLSKSGLSLLNCDYYPVQQQAVEITTTKSCVFWFGERTIFIDTAGVYTRPDFASEQSSELWLGFINLLQRHFGEHLIRDVLIILDVPVLLDEKLLGDTLDCLRRRVYEVASLAKKLQLHIVVTKSDRILGFNDYFATLSDEECAQPFGLVFEQFNQNSLIAEFESGFKQLLSHLSNRLIDQLQYGAVGSDPVLVKAFPSEFAQLHGPILSTLSKIPYGSHIRLCGLFFVSSCQHGEVLDPIKRLMQNKIGTGDQSEYAPEYLGNRDYFIREFFQRLSNQYAHELSNNTLRSRNIWVIAIIVMTLLFGCWFWQSYVFNFKQLKLWSKANVATLLQDDPLLVGPQVKTSWWVLCDSTKFLRLLWQRRDQDRWLTSLATRLANGLSESLDMMAQMERDMPSGTDRGQDFLAVQDVFERFNAYLMLTGIRPWSKEWLVKWLQCYPEMGTGEDCKWLNSWDRAGVLPAANNEVVKRVAAYLRSLPTAMRVALVMFDSRNDQFVCGRRLAPWQIDTILKETLMRLERPGGAAIMQPPVFLDSTFKEQLQVYVNWYVGHNCRNRGDSAHDTQFREWLERFLEWVDSLDSKVNDHQRGGWQSVKGQLRNQLLALASSSDGRSEALSYYLRQGRTGYGITPFGEVENWLSANRPSALGTYHLWQVSFWNIMVKWMRQEMLSSWNNEVVPFYQQKIAFRYPFLASSNQDVSLDDFGAFFGPRGIVNRYYRKWVAPFCAFTNDIPSWLAPVHRQQEFPLEILEATVRADLITKAFYPVVDDVESDSHPVIKVRFTMIPQTVATKDNIFQINIDGQLLDAQETAPQQLCWPGPQPESVTVRGKDKDGNYVMRSVVGDWAWFRVLEQAQVTQTDARHMDVIFELGNEATARSIWRFSMRVDGRFNPFNLKLLRGLHLTPINDEVSGCDSLRSQHINVYKER